MYVADVVVATLSGYLLLALLYTKNVKTFIDSRGFRTGCMHHPIFKGLN